MKISSILTQIGLLSGLLLRIELVGSFLYNSPMMTR
jgi:hypothetical protein